MPNISTTAVHEDKSMEILRAAYHDLKAEHNKLRIRDAAAMLGVTEAELVACDLDDQSFLLDGSFRDILQALPEVGPVMCLCRNASAVHERHGRFEDVHVGGGHIGLVLGPDIDLRLFLEHWRYAFYLTQALASGQRESIQFFDNGGDAVLKIYATERTNIDAFRALGQHFRAASQPHVLHVDTTAANDDSVESEGGVSRETLRACWSGLRDTHEFHGMLKNLCLSRMQALRTVGEDYALELPLKCVESMLVRACEAGVPIMVFVGNRGCIQIHSGPVKQFKRLGDWINILDPEFNLHLAGETLASAWLVRKPSDDGDITSVEVYDANEELVVQVFGARKPGIPERKDWRELARSLANGATS